MSGWGRGGGRGGGNQNDRSWGSQYGGRQNYRQANFQGGRGYGHWNDGRDVRTTPFYPPNHSEYREREGNRGGYRGDDGRGRHYDQQRGQDYLRSNSGHIPKKSRTNESQPSLSVARLPAKMEEESPVSRMDMRGAFTEPQNVKSECSAMESEPVGDQGARPLLVKKERKQKPFAEMSRKEKFESQYRYSGMDWSTFPVEAFAEESDYWKAKKEEASRYAIEKAVERMHQNALTKIEEIKEEDEENGISSSDDDDYNDPYSDNPRSRRPEDHYDHSKGDIARFLGAAPDCMFLTVGFDVLGLKPGDDKHCYCPCGRDMIKWQEQFHLTNILEGKDVEACRKKCDPLGIMGHVRTLAKSCILHYGLMLYLERLYSKDSGNYRGGVGHKAMYQLNDKNWKKADAAEKREKFEDMEKIKAQLLRERSLRMKAEEDREEHRKKMELLKKVNEDQYKELNQLEETRKALGVERKQEVPVSKEELGHYRDFVHVFFDAIRNDKKSMKLPASRVRLPGKKETDDPLEIQVGQKVDLQTFFDTWYDKSLKGGQANDATMLFRSLDLTLPEKDMKNYYGYKIILDWNVQFSNEYKYGRTKKGRERKEEDTAIDEGGPTREFLSQCWSQLGDLGVKVGVNQKKVLLFEMCPEGVQPESDEKLKHQIISILQTEDMAVDESPFVARAMAYYRGVGRIMLHSLATRHAISSSAVPPFYQNWLFRCCRPGDSDYHKDDVLCHLVGIGSTTSLEGWKSYAAEDSGEEVIEDRIFSEFIPEQFLEPRMRALCAIKEGLTLGNNYAISKIFRPMPLNAVQKVAFSYPAITAEAVIGILQPTYCVGWEGDPVDQVEHLKIQEEFFNGTLQEVLTRDREQSGGSEEFLSSFVHFCTGLNYLPDPDGNPDYKINVEFSFEEAKMDDYPVSHTCVNLLTLPGYLYSNEDDFERKLDEAMLCSKEMPFFRA